MFDERRTLKSPSGAVLRYHLAEAAAPRAILVVCHGLAEHARRYAGFADAMAAAGFHTLVHDHRGHGETTAPDAPIGRFAHRDGVEAVVADTLAMRAEAVALFPGLPVVLFGHSMGGLIAVNTAEQMPEGFVALAVWNSNLAPGLAGRAALCVLAVERMLLGSDVPSPLLPRLTFEAWGRAIPGRRTLFDWLSHDPAEVDAYVADPLCGFGASVSLWQDIFRLTFRAMEPARLSRLPKTLPIQLVGGGEDPATDKAGATRILSKNLQDFGFSAVTTQIYHEMRHETLHESGKEAAIADFVAWCGEALGQR